MTARELLINKFEEYEKGNQWGVLYETIHKLSLKQEETNNLSTKMAMMKENVEKNRYRDVLAYDHCRVKLKNVDNGHSDYINATPITMDQARRKYILSQGPLSNTCRDFWQMVWGEGVRLIVMLNRVIEKSSIKCHQYFPTDLNSKVEFDDLEITLTSVDDCKHYFVRRLQLRRRHSEEDEVVEVQHFQYVSWPDFGVPHATIPFLEFLEAIRATGQLDQPNPPTVVHCSAGIGRSGTFVLVDAVLRMVELGIESIDLLDLVVKYRRDRMGLIQTPPQLRFCWHAIVDSLQQSSTPIPALHRSCANRLTSGLQAKSFEEVPRKRFHHDGDSTDEGESEAKLIRKRRAERVEAMRNRMRQSETDGRRPWGSWGPWGPVAIAVTVGLVSVAVLFCYRTYHLTT